MLTLTLRLRNDTRTPTKRIRGYFSYTHPYNCDPVQISLLCTHQSINTKAYGLEI